MAIEIKDLSFSYRGHDVLHDVSFSAADGDVAAVLGPNGVGKSTLFRCMLGFLKPQKGSITVDGRDISAMDRREAARTIAYIPQNSNPVFNYTVEDVVLMGATNRLGMFSTPGQEDIERAGTIMDSLGILPLKDRPCGKISGGERQLTLLARALLQDARVLIMDEPTAALDYGNQLRVMERIEELAGHSYTVIFSTHDPNQAFRHASKVLAMREGRVHAAGQPVDVLTTTTLSRLYGIDIAMGSVATQGGDVTVIVPERKE